MKTKRGYKDADGGMTVVELSLTMAVMIMLATIVMFSTSGISDWKLARFASLELKKVYIAQKSYLADHPTVPVDTLTEAMLLPYLGSGATALPTVESLEGSMLPIKVDVMPPVVTEGATPYDPSGDSEDGLWDVGAP